MDNLEPEPPGTRLFVPPLPIWYSGHQFLTYPPGIHSIVFILPNGYSAIRPPPITPTGCSAIRSTPPPPPITPTG